MTENQKERWNIEIKESFT